MKQWYTLYVFLYSYAAFMIPSCAKCYMDIIDWLFIGMLFEKDNILN